MTNNILQPLIKSNVALLTQKIGLLDVLVARHNGSIKLASEQFANICPLVGASIGQHYRHSMDHIELAALVASSIVKDDSSSSSSPSQDVAELHYDLRVRGGTLEKDLELSRQRIVNVVDVLQSLQSKENDDTITSTTTMITNSPITAYFNLSADSNDEIGLPSTVGRELGFAAHHAIHHMAMCKVIAVQTLGVDEEELPHGFGRAPSTLLFDRNQK